MRRFLMLSLVLSACNDDGGAGRLADAPPVADAPVAQPVTLTVTRNGGPVAGVHVYFLNPDNSVVLTTDTDATGTASALMPGGGSVTAIDPFPSEPVPAAVAIGDNDLRTFDGVAPGDHLALNQDDEPAIDITLIAPSAPNASNYQVHTTCGSGTIFLGGGSGSGVPGGVVSLRNCHGTADILLLAQDAASGQTTAALYHPNADLKSGTVDLSADTFQPVSDVGFTFTKVPDTVSFVGISHSLATPRGRLVPPFSTETGIEAGTASMTLKEPTLAGTTSIVDARLPQNALHHLVDWGAPSASYSLDVTGLLLPDLLDQPSYNATTKRVSWTQGKAGATPDFTVLQIQVSHNDGQQNWRWTIAAPYTAGELKFPTLPTDVFDWSPVPQADFVEVAALAYAKTPGGYDAARAHALDLFGLASRFPQLDARKLVTGATGRAAITEIQVLKGRTR